MTLVVAVLLSLAIFFASRAVFSVAARPNITADRLRGIAAAGADATSGGAGANMADRVAGSLVRGLADRTAGLMPARMAAHFETQLIRAGEPMTLAPFLAMVALTPMTFAGLGAAALARGGSAEAGPLAGAVVTLGGFGLALPIIWLRGRVTRRQTRIRRELPDALDLLVVSVEAGLGLEAAMSRVTEGGRGPVVLEFQRVIADMNLGLGRRAAMQGLATRTGVPAVGSLVAAILQADRTGMGIGQVLRAQAEHLRTQRRLAAEETAMKAPLKMLFPLVFFIFPALFVVILAPALLTFMETMNAP